MKIIKLEAENFKRLKVIEIEPKTHIIKLTGKNEAGKTSVLDAIWCAMGGDKVQPSKPIREGEESARVEIDLGDYTVKRTWTEKSSYLTVKDKDGNRFASPQALLNKLVGDLTFDPQIFLNSTNQKELLLSLVTLTPNWEEWKKLTGIGEVQPEQAKEPINYMDDVRKQFYDERTGHNAEVKRLKGTITTAEAAIPQGMEATEVVSIEKLLEQRKTATAAWDQRKDQIAKTEVALQKINSNKDLSQQNYQQVGELQEKITQLRSLIDQRAKDTEVLETAHKEMMAAITLEDQLPNVDAIDQKMSQAQTHNAVAGQVQALKGMQTELKKKEEDSWGAGNKIKAIDEFKKKTLSASSMPLEGLSVENDEVTFKNVPLSQCSHAQKLKVSIGIGMALNPTLKVLRITEGEKFDKDSWAVVEEIAAKNDYQLWVEKMEESGEVGVFIEEGEIKSIDGVPIPKDPPTEAEETPAEKG